MKRLTYLLGAILSTGMLALSCAKTLETEPDPSAQGTVLPAAPADSVTFTAFLESGTRTQLGEDLTVRWSAGDLIRVFNESHPEGVECELKDGAGTTAGTFIGPVSGSGPFLAVYPSSAGTALEGGTLRISLPREQAYSADSFGPGANLSAGKADELEGIRFVNLLGALSLTLTGDKSVSGIRIISFDAFPLFGTAAAGGLDEGETPALTFDNGQTGEEFRQITLDCGSGVPLSGEGKTFYLSLPPGALTAGYLIEVFDTEGNAMVKYAKASAGNGIDRSEIRSMPVLTYRPGYKTAFLESGEIGAFSAATTSDSEMADILRYVKGQSQYAFRNRDNSRYLRLEDWEAGRAIGFTMPYNLSPGTNCSVTLQAIGAPSVTSGTVANMRIVKRSGGKVWMLDPQTGNGFILMMMEE